MKVESAQHIIWKSRQVDKICGDNPGPNTTGLLERLFIYIFPRLAQASVQALYNLSSSPVVLGPGCDPVTVMTEAGFHCDPVQYLHQSSSSAVAPVVKRKSPQVSANHLKRKYLSFASSQITRSWFSSWSISRSQGTGPCPYFLDICNYNFQFLSIP